MKRLGQLRSVPSPSLPLLSGRVLTCSALVHIVCVFPIVLLSVCAVFFVPFFSDPLCSMAPKCDLSEKDSPPGKNQTRKSITIEQKMDISRRYDRGESAATIRNALNLPESTLRTIKKGREKITAAFKAGEGSASTRVSSGHSTFIVRLEKMLVTWMDHRKRQGLNVAFNDTKKKAMECYQHLKEKETTPLPEFTACTGWFYKFKNRYAIRSVKHSGEAKSTDEDAAASYPDRLRAIIKEGGHKPSRCLTWMKQACSRRCLNACTSRRKRSLHLASKCSRTVSPSC